MSTLPCCPDLRNQQKRQILCKLGEVYLGSDGVLDAHHSDTGELVQNIILAVPVWFSSLSREVPVGHTDGP